MRSAHLRHCAIVLLCAMALGGCDPEARQAAGFSLPQGDKAAGEQTFYAMQCDSCHTIKGSENIPAQKVLNVSVVLGGEVGRVKTYGELVTSIINPSHRITKRYAAEEVSDNGESKMIVFNDVMTVTELVNLVAFLQSKYQLAPQIVSEYRMYAYP